MIHLIGTYINLAGGLFRNFGETVYFKEFYFTISLGVIKKEISISRFKRSQLLVIFQNVLIFDDCTDDFLKK